eukprot:GEMP01009364.1.p1 GENE.GEMP01009364.1~~GEMP01009364.1.p1  ORF type:complete len:278 (+),score=31.81 GEMP01009364.1:124-957(+)
MALTEEGERVAAGTLAGWKVIVAIELWTLGHCFFFSFGVWDLVIGHLWAIFYSTVGVMLSRKKEWSVMIDGYPMWSYALNLTNHFAVLPILVTCSIISAVDKEQWLYNSFSSLDSFSASIFYSIIGCMIKDEWLTKEHPKNIMGFGLIFHHFAAISACVITLNLAGGAGFAVLGTVVIEFGSGLFNLHSVLQHPYTLVTYLLTTPISNIVALTAAYKIYFLGVSQTFGHAEFYVALAIAIVIIRQAGWIMQLNVERQALKANDGKALLSKTMVKKLC